MLNEQYFQISVAPINTINTAEPCTAICSDDSTSLPLLGKKAQHVKIRNSPSQRGLPLVYDSENVNANQTSRSFEIVNHSAFHYPLTLGSKHGGFEEGCRGNFLFRKSLKIYEIKLEEKQDLENQSR